ncbi:hypothetical protein LOTGIDRAFT_155816 [Lottia gigantea]|uniref:Uncharacterized protein n=1 Tax=Lottia gigantea TaxID=225164 RepID=V4B2P2_LOTGI|nr:hypothetical protein LOTGIDRAFT_155816 [Lottia gigantea]ESO82789.1 hypothetical protein LOTGIDRAFT_155816 [Lottia gigantea]
MHSVCILCNNVLLSIVSCSGKHYHDNKQCGNVTIRGKSQGSDPLIQTARGKLQTRRSKLNDQINKELRMRNGAENLYRATSNKKLKEQVAVELSFFNSNIQLLKEELAELNSSVHIYQHDNCAKCVPMIPLGLKETTEVDCSVPIKDYLLEHYSEEPEKFINEIQELHNIRQAIRTPVRDIYGLELLMEYFNQLYYIEKRFFPTDKHLSIHFHWYDSLSGVPSTQKAIGFEKGSVLYNIGALYTQLACKQDRTTISGLEDSITYFVKAAGAFLHLECHFRNAPSMDMQPSTLLMLASLMQCQAQECVLEKCYLKTVQNGILATTKMAQEAALVSEKYRDTHRLMISEPVKSYIPFSWISMAQTKHYYYKGLAHYYIASGLLDQKDSDDMEKIKTMFQGLQIGAEGRDENNGLKLPTNSEDRKIIGKAHLKESVLGHEEALRVHDLCKQLRKVDHYGEILDKTHERALKKFSALEEEDDFSDLVTVARIQGKSENDVVSITPEFSKIKVTDIFRKLGPISIFNAKNEWSTPRLVSLHRNTGEGFGFSVRGDSPVIIADIEPESVAGYSSMKVGDFVVGVGNVDTLWSKHEEVVQIVRQAGSDLDIRLVTPVNTNFLEPVPRVTSTISLPSTPVKNRSRHNSTSSERTNNKSNRLSAPWIFMKKDMKKERSEDDAPEDIDFENISR